MKPSLRNRLDSIDARLEDLLNSLHQYDEAQLNRRPAPEKWSALMVMHHLIVAEEGSLKYLKKKMSFQPQLRRAGIQEQLRSLALGIFLNLPFKFRAPDGAGDAVLPAESTLAETADHWRGVRSELRSFLEDLPSGHEHLALYRHPFAGRLSLDGMLRFFDHHFERHRRQIERTLA